MIESSDIKYIIEISHQQYNLHLNIIAYIEFIYEIMNEYYSILPDFKWNAIFRQKFRQNRHCCNIYTYKQPRLVKLSNEIYKPIILKLKYV